MQGAVLKLLNLVALLQLLQKRVMSSAMLLLVLVAATTTSATNFNDCATRLSTLELALYQTEDNLFELNKIYFPPSSLTSKFIRVNYEFLDEQNELSGCNVTYIWAIGSYLFIQPPTVFMFNSLFFYYPNNGLTILPLKLPSECIPLLSSEVNGECSCTNASAMLETLTQQVPIRCFLRPSFMGDMRDVGAL